MIIQDVQKAVFAALNADGPFHAACPRLYDHVPQGTAYPYSKLLCSSQDDGDKSQAGEMVDIELHVWSQYRGAKEAQDIARLAYAVLHHHPAAASSVDVSTSVLVHLNSFLAVEPDGLTRHLVARFQARAQSTTQFT